MRVCKLCAEEKPHNMFYREKRNRDGLMGICKICHNNRNREWVANNRERVREIHSDWRNRNIEKDRELSREYQKKYRAKHPEAGARWAKENPEKRKETMRRADRKRYSTPKGKLLRTMRRNIWTCLKNGKAGASWESLVGYSLGDLKDRLESQFMEGMTWDNYGEWHIDHIIPKSVFNFSKPEHRDFKRCWDLNNLQPLWARENIQKSNKLDKHFQPRLAMG